MGESTVYTCDYCKATYSTQEEAESCEASHARDLEIVDMKYKPVKSFNSLNKYLQLELDSFPVSITIMDSRGIKVVYSVTRQQLENQNQDSNYIYDDYNQEFIDKNHERI